MIRWLMMLVGVLVCAPAVGQDSKWRDRWHNVPVYSVATSNSPPMAKRGCRYYADSTAAAGGAEVAIQQAIDKAHAAGGGIVFLNEGTYYYAEPADETVYTGTAFVGSPSNYSVLEVDSWGEGFSISDVTVGDFIRVSQSGENTDPAATYDNIVLTVTAIDTENEKITLNGRYTIDWEDPDVVAFSRVVAAIEMKKGVALIGQNHSTTRLRLADDNHCTAISQNGTSANDLVWAVRYENFDITPATAATEFNGLDNGIMIGRYTAETNITNVSVWYSGGDGFIINHGHGVRMDGDCWAENNRGYGLVLANGDETCANNVMLTGNYIAGLLMHHTTRASIANCWSNVTQDDSYAVIMQGAHRNTINGNRFYIGSTKTGVAGLVYMDDSGYQNAITGNTFELLADAAHEGIDIQTGHSNAITGNVMYMFGKNTVGINLDHYWNSIVGNQFFVYGAGATTLEMSNTYAGCNVVKNNAGTNVRENIDIVRVLNNTGGTLARTYAVMRRVGQGDVSDEVELCTAINADRFLGVVRKDATIADGAYGWVQTEGFTTQAAVNGTDDIATGDELEIGGEVGGDGVFELAEEGDYVVAIAEAAITADETATTGDIYILPKGARYYKKDASIHSPVVKTVIKTIDVDDDASTDDFQFDDDAENATEQTVDLGELIPAYAEVMSVQLRCFETVTGSTAVSIDLGTSDGGAELLGAANIDSANDIDGTATGAGPKLEAANTAKHVWINATPGANWNTLDAGRWSVMVTYLDYGDVHSRYNQ